MSKEKEVIAKAVSYWSSFLKDPSTSKFDNGDDSQNGAMAFMLAELGKPSSHPESEIKHFEELLTLSLEVDKPSWLDVDYHPCRHIDDSAEKALSNYNSMSTFPCKTDMNINYETGSVSVSQGYRAESKDI